MQYPKKIMTTPELTITFPVNVNQVDSELRKTEWRRFELLTEDPEELKMLDDVLDRKDLNRQDLAVILFSLRVRPEFQKSDFGI